MRAERATTCDEYKKQYSEIRHVTVNLPSGAVFRLKSIDQRTLNRLLAQMDITLQEYENLVNKKFKKMSPTEISRYIDFWDAIIVESVEDPKMCIEPEEGKLEVGLLASEDMEKLQEEIGKLTAETAELPMKLVTTALPISDAAKITVSKLILNSDKYEGKYINVGGRVEREAGDIGIITRKGKSVILQRFYIADGKKAILVFRFYPKGDRLYVGSALKELIGKGDDPVKVNIENGKFTVKLIDEPVIVTHSEKMEKVKDMWVQIALKNM